MDEWPSTHHCGGESLSGDESLKGERLDAMALYAVEGVDDERFPRLQRYG
jgi:hypothetical protein